MLEYKVELFLDPNQPPQIRHWQMRSGPRFTREQGIEQTHGRFLQGDANKARYSRLFAEMVGSLRK
jgi:hypothetical protein